MEMKEFHYQDGLRVSLFNVDDKAVPFHFHNCVTDLMYCSRGAIRIELPDLGEVFAVPHPTRHRFVNGAPSGTESRYVLLQIGEFDITFLPDADGIAEQLNGRAATPITDSAVYIETRKIDIAALADRFAAERPDVLTHAERDDVVTALRAFAGQGTESAHPHATATT
ncbi:hypothetical protein [Pseudonocardia sp. ICBG1293]|uniref:hypothetical protein n=1 Tax=Pseudonocardia sp. ICBG1293 TaxID=2844382 RepID=UPI001CCDB798|nr:hypothetical protein [Pseudonocardia sp. ICBG1293]